MATIKAIRNHVIFQFVDKKTRHMGVSQFEEATDWGFTFVRVDDTTGNPRWGVVKVVGHEVPEDIQPGMAVLIESLKWTNEFEVDGELFWRTDSDSILAIDEDTIPA